MMTTYRRAGVASTFSPTFAAVLAEAESFARHCGADLEIIHAAEFDAEKERRFRNAMGQAAAIRWVSEYPPAQAIISAARDYDYELVIAGALQVEDADRPFTSSVARELMRDAPCDSCWFPGRSSRPMSCVVLSSHSNPARMFHISCSNSLKLLRPEHVTIAVTETPFAAAIAASRGEELQDVDAWLEELCAPLFEADVEIETRVVHVEHRLYVYAT